MSPLGQGRGIPSPTVNRLERSIRRVSKGFSANLYVDGYLTIHAHPMCRCRPCINSRDALLHLPCSHCGHHRFGAKRQSAKASDCQYKGASWSVAQTSERYELTLTPRAQRQSTICELLFPTTILAVKLNRRRLVVVLEDEIYVYDISNMKLLHTIETSPNPQGPSFLRLEALQGPTQLTQPSVSHVPTAICALSPCSEPCYLAYPSPVPSPASPFSGSSNAQTPGDVMIFDLLSLQVSNIIQAHKTPISHLAINATGTLLATASDKGTVVRVFSVPGAQMVGQYRRGAYPARIYSISFNAVSTLLSVSSDTETVHIFKLNNASLGGPGSTASSRPSLTAAAGGSSPSFGSEDGSENGLGRESGGGYEALMDDKKKAGGLK